jgi:hypothetical protein
MRTERDETVGVVIHTCMEITQENSLCSSLYLQLTKISCFSSYFICLYSTKLENRRVEQVLWGGGWHKWGEGGGEKGLEDKNDPN